MVIEMRTTLVSERLRLIGIMQEGDFLGDGHLDRSVSTTVKVYVLHTFPCPEFAFSKSSLNIWKFSVHILLKPSLENFEHSFVACEMSAVVR